MKQIILLFTLAIGSAASAQTIRIADNNANAPTGANVYTTLQAAINAAQQDDIVYITPSTTSYGNATVGKRITIKGVGFGITELGSKSSTIGVLSISNSSNGTDNISGSVFTGFSFTTIQFINGTGGTTFNNITIENVFGGNIDHSACIPNVDMLRIRNTHVTSITLGSCSTISNLYLYNNVINGIRQLTISNSANTIITNNLFYSTIDPFGNQFMTITCQNSTGVRVEHNLFSGSGPTFRNLFNALVVNNIFFGKTPASGIDGASLFSDNTFSNNLVLASFSMPPSAIGGSLNNTGVGNITGTGPLFSNAAVTSTWAASTGFDYTLLPGSVCIGAATTGENIGPSGGLYPINQNIRFSATALPVITLFGNSGVVPQNQPLKSNIKAKAN
jgi:hypothetical protein